MKRVAIFIAKILGSLMGLMGRGGSLPGVVALKLDGKILRKLKYPSEVIIVTGTNGKTSITNMIADVYEAAGRRVLTNRKGDNLKRGIVSLMMGAVSFGGKVRADAVILEVDELSVPRIMEDMKPDLVFVNNLFRDQLDRAGEMETIITRLARAFETYDGKLLLNGDDPNVVRLGLNTRAEVKYFGLAQYEGSTLECDEALEGGFCPECGSKLLYEYYQYSHVGRFLCEICGFGNFDIKYIVEEIDFERSVFVYREREFELMNMSVFGVYNAIGVIAVSSEGGVDDDYAAKVLEKFSLGNGRMEVFEFGDKKCLLNLIKNPTGANEVMKYIQMDGREKEVLIVLNDGIADGKDVSWIWDTRFDLIARENVNKIICSGARCYDMAARIKYLGYDEEQISVQEELSVAVDELAGGSGASYVLVSYTGLQPVRRELGRASRCTLVESI